MKKQRWVYMGWMTIKYTVCEGTERRRGNKK
jgi:hypothetical protein